MVMVQHDSKDHRTYISELVKTLATSSLYQDKVDVKNRCVTVRYSEPSKLEVDLVPCVERNGKFYVCPRYGDDFEETDGTGYRDWFNEQNDITSGNLKRVVRLLKYVRDHRVRLEKCPSIVLTTLAAKAIKNGDQATESVSTQANTLVTVLSRMSENLDKTPYPLSVKNTALPSETFNPRWTRAEYDRFRSTIRAMAKDARAALLESDKEKSIAKWQKVCGEKFAVAKGGNRRGNGSSQRTGGHAAAAGPVSIANRPNEAHPFG